MSGSVGLAATMYANTYQRTCGTSWTLPGASFFVP